MDRLRRKLLGLPTDPRRSPISDVEIAEAFPAEALEGYRPSEEWRQTKLDEYDS